jgi:L-2,4-diaminobutyrate decarboxylase
VRPLIAADLRGSIPRSMSIPAFDDDSRRFAHEVVDLLFDHVQSIESRPVVDWKPSTELRELVRLDAEPESPDTLVRRVLGESIQLHHPSYMGHQVCPPFPAAVLGDLLISTINQSTAVWEMSPIGTVIEKEVVRWLADLAGYPAGSEGTLVSGGSAANLTGLLAARARWNADASGKRPVILCSADAHYSIARAASILGLAPEATIKVKTDAEHRLDVDALDEILAALEEDPARSVMAIVATAGSTATGAFDRLEDIAGLRDRYRTWLHVDAAHGASVLLSERLGHLAHGLRHADSFSWDPHKMMWMPLSLGAILVRQGEWLRRAFEADAPYLFHAERAGENLGEMTIQCSKRADAIKLWLSLRMYGAGAFAEALEKVAEVTRFAYELVEESEDFEAMHVPHFNIFCFRHKTGDNGAMREKLIRSGEAWITSTILRGERVLRITVINPRTERSHIEAMLDAIRAQA